MSLAPRALARLASLTSLVVDNQDEGGPFLASKGGLQGLGGLASFRLSHARLGGLDHTLFHQDVRHNLIKVFLTHNGLARIEPHALCGMPRLSDLDLSCNKLGVASLDFLQCTPSLYLLNLSRNALQELPLASLTHSPTLHTLDLSHNNLSSAAALVAALNATASLRQVFLAGNPWRCNRTALLQLHGLRAARLQVSDWRFLACRRGEERLLVQEWLFPHAGGGVRAWHVILGVTGVAGGLCCLLGVRGRLRRLPPVPWLWPRKVLPYDVGRLAPDSPPGKLPKPPTCMSVLAVPEEVVPPPKDGPLKGLVNGISEALIDKVLSELPRPAPRGEEDGAPETSYVSYKSRLDPEERRPAGHPRRQQEQQVLSAPGRPLPGDAGEGSAAVTQERDDEDVSDENLPLTTSAGVATSPTETQTISVAGLRGVRQYTVASWLTLEAPQSSSRPLPEPPAPRDLLAAKIQQRDASATFTLTRPPPHCPGVTEEHPHRSPSRQQERPPPPASPQGQPFTSRGRE
ncbi:hypothetical protein O3P69_005048 [Scylla paramamosain]|uniref:Uncharacterized protein n=1 Tax=Scylla paramamosain TaxID=85552 RepID=A0AAW0UDB0_SCYPA